MTKTKVFWTILEQQQLIEHVVDTLLNRGCSLQTRPIDLFRMAQEEILPVCRQRPLKGFSNIEKLWTQVIFLRNRGGNNKKDTTVGQQKNVQFNIPSHEHVIVKDENEKEQQTEIDTVLLSFKKLLVEVSQLLINTIIDSPIICDALRKQLKEDMQETIRETLQEQNVDGSFILSNNSCKNKEKLRKIVIVGPLPNQQRNIREQFGKVLDLRFWCGHGGKGKAQKLFSMCRQADEIVALVDFLSHEYEDQIKKTNRPYTRVKGGMGALSIVLVKIVNTVEKHIRHSESN